MCASFQSRVVEHLVDRLKTAVQLSSPATVAIAGGVASNRALRGAVEVALAGGPPLVVPAPELCTDNAAMIGAAALVEWERRGPDPAPFDADPGLSFS